MGALQRTKGLSHSGAWVSLSGWTGRLFSFISRGRQLKQQMHPSNFIKTWDRPPFSPVNVQHHIPCLADGIHGCPAVCSALKVTCLQGVPLPGHHQANRGAEGLYPCHSCRQRCAWDRAHRKWQIRSLCASSPAEAGRESVWGVCPRPHTNQVSGTASSMHGQCPLQLKVPHRDLLCRWEDHVFWQPSEMKAA